MSAIATDLWQRLAAYEIGPPVASLTFAARLARENRWSAAFTERVLREYKRFCYLAVMAGHEVTPSDAVDQAWHLHLTYTRDYWERFCPEVLRMPLHHGPTAGGHVERTRYYDQYALTLKAYEEHFGEAPPADIWAPAARRFGVDPLSYRVNPRDVLVLRRPTVIVIVVAAAMLLMAGALVVGGS
ncbi:MAG: hypothetical protein KJZ64_04570 [Sphingomonadaceae bacterium]|nr:hypothetical protein [Sphingomonadaceae bacterium]